MANWDYKIMVFSGTGSAVESDMSTQGASGWEAVGVMFDPSVSYDDNGVITDVRNLVVLFKKSLI